MTCHQLKKTTNFQARIKELEEWQFALNNGKKAGPQEVIKLARIRKPSTKASAKRRRKVVLDKLLLIDARLLSDSQKTLITKLKARI